MNIDPDSIRLVGEADLLKLVGLGRGAWNGWVKSAHVSQSSDGLYREQDVIELAVLRLMADWMPMAKAVITWRDCQADLISRCTERRLDDDRAIDLVVDLHTLGAESVEDPQDLLRQTARPGAESARENRHRARTEHPRAPSSILATRSASF